METIVIGHRNPDMDSICSAIGYARLKQLIGWENVVAARAGNTNERIDHVLGKFGVEAPVLLSDVSPRVRDLMQREVVCVPADSTVYDAIQVIADKQLRGLPVIDGGNRCVGLLSAGKVTHHLFPSRDDASSARKTRASLEAIVKTFGGRTVTGALPATVEEHILMVAAMSIDSFSGRLSQHDASRVVLFVGDREDIQMHAITAGVRGIVVTGGLTVPALVRNAAEQKRVAIISSPHDTATTVLLARGAVGTGGMLEPFTSFGPDTLLDLAKQSAAGTAAFVFPVLNEDGTLAGVLSKSDFIRPVPRQLILVDHNELSQAVPGAEALPVIEILDHHRIGGFSSRSPVLFWNNPVGSTCTIVALCYRQMQVPIPRDIAGILMAGLISDTLNLSSPTSTAIDKEVLQQLSAVANVSAEGLAQEIFSIGSPLLTMTSDQAITADCKEYHENGSRFSIAQVEELNFSHFAEKQQGLIESLDRYCRKNGYCFSGLLVTDVNTQTSLLVASGKPEILNRIQWPAHGPQVWELAGVVSRKKQLLPYILHCITGQ